MYYSYTPVDGYEKFQYVKSSPDYGSETNTIYCPDRETFLNLLEKWNLESKYDTKYYEK